MFPMEESDQIGSRPIEVLMVDDDANFVKIVEHHLQRYQAREFHLTWKERVADALTELSKNSGYDIILTDYNFPASNGLDFCLRLNERGLQIPIIFLTGVRDFKLAIDAMKLGVEDFIVKEGRVVSDRLARYRIPSIVHTPEIISLIVEDPAREGPYGAKGVGEIVSIPTTPAITNAIYNAVGIRIDRLPVDQEQIALALRVKSWKQRKPI